MVLAETIAGITEASMIRSPSSPSTQRLLGVAIRSGLDQRHAFAGILAEAVGEHAAGCPATDDDVVVLAHSSPVTSRARRFI
jgi:hypothetical protein